MKQELFWEIMRHCLWVMRLARARGRSSVGVSEIAFYLRQHGIHATHARYPDFWAVERALGPRGLQLRKLSSGYFPIPQSTKDFIVDRERGIHPPDFAEAHLDALCAKYEVPPLRLDEPQKETP